MRNGLKQQIPAFGGLIGTPIINKANWLFNYPKKKLTVSNAHLADETFKSIKISRQSGVPYADINIGGTTYKAMIDMGSSSALSVPEGSPLAQILLNKYKFQDNERPVYTIGGMQKVKERIGMIPNLKIGDIDFSGVPVDIRKTSALRIGARFFMEYVLYIDNINRDFKIKIK